MYIYVRMHGVKEQELHWDDVAEAIDSCMHVAHTKVLLYCSSWQGHSKWGCSCPLNYTPVDDVTHCYVVDIRQTDCEQTRT